MREILADLERWRASGARAAVARVVGVDGSGPRDPGAAMAVNEAGEVVGSVSGGCVEGAVVGEALDVLASGDPGRLVTFGYSDDEAYAVGLTCGGTVHLFIQPWSSEAFAEPARRISTARPTALITVLDGPGRGATLTVAPGEAASGTLGHPDLDRVAARDAIGELDAGRTSIRHYGPHGETTPEDLEDAPTVRVFVESFAAPPRMWIFGAVDFTAALARVAKVLGHHVVVCDARGVFATARRFPMADEVLVSWPRPVFQERGAELGPRDAVCILTHDPKFDVPAILGALATRVGYIGVMGSRSTHAARLERLAEAGVVAPEDLARLMSPIGLDIGARTPEETAVSICAEIIGRRVGRAVPSLRESSGPIHH